MVTTGVTVAGAKGGCGTTAVTILTAFGLASAGAPSLRPVMMDCNGDLAATLDISDELPGLAEIAAGEGSVEDGVWELGYDAEAAATMPGFVGRGSSECPPAATAMIAADLVAANFCPVIDCGSGHDAAPLLDALQSGPVMSHFVTLVPSPAAANAAVRLGRAGPGGRRILVDLGIETVVSAAEFASVFDVDATIDAIPEWQDWLLAREVPQMLARAAQDTTRSAAGDALRTLTGLLLHPLG